MTENCWSGCLRTRRPIQPTRRVSPTLTEYTDSHEIGGADVDCVYHNIYDAMEPAG